MWELRNRPPKKSNFVIFLLLVVFISLGLDLICHYILKVLL